MQPHERLSELRRALGWTQGTLASRLTVSNVTVNRWENGARALDMVTALAIEAITGANSRWLMLGESPMWKGEAPGEPPRKHSEDCIDRPLIPGIASCGPGGEILDPGPQAETHPLRLAVAQRILQDCGGGSIQDLFWLKVSGQSMIPTIRDGEMVLVNAGLPIRLAPRNHGVYLVRRTPAEVEARVKRLRMDLTPGMLTLVSDNQSFAPITVDPDGIPLQQLLLGRVVLVNRYLIGLDPDEADW